MRGPSKSAVWLLVTLTLLLAVAGTAAAQQRTNLTWWTYASASTEASEIYNNLIARYTQLNPNVSIELSFVEGFDDKLKVTIAAGSGTPDFFTAFFPLDTPRHGWMLDLTPYMERDGIVPERIWFPLSAERIKYNGRYYGVPREIAPGALGYNIDILNRAGVPEPPADYDLQMFEQDIMKLNRPDDGIYGLGAEARGAGTLEWTVFASNLDVKLVSLDGTQVVGYMDSEETIAAFDWFVGFTKRGFTLPPEVRYRDGRLWSNQVAMDPIATFEIPQLRAAGTNYGIHPGPTRTLADEPKAWADTIITHAYAKTPHPEEVWQYLKWISTDLEAIEIFAEGGLTSPPLIEAWRALRITDDPLMAKWFQLASLPAEVPNYLRTEYQWSIVQPGLDQAWNKDIQGTTPIAAGLKEAAQTVQSQLDAEYAK